MRAAEYGVEGDEQAELTVFYFGEGQGGAVEPNIARSDRAVHPGRRQ